jgi:hypothetical protein
MTDELGTRIRTSQPNNRIDQGVESRLYTRDLGMTKMVLDLLTFSSAQSRITGIPGEFSVFALWDPIECYGAQFNNGYFTITFVAADGSYVLVDPPPVNEGPVLCVVRTT